jgi:hypothetical protein
MKRLVGPSLLLGSEGRLVNEEIRLTRDLEHLERRPRVAGEDDLPARARGSEYLLGTHAASLWEVDGLAALEPSEERALRDAQRARGFEVEATRPRVLDDAVAVGPDTVLDCEGEDPVIAALERVSRRELLQVDVVGELPEDPAQDAEELDEARGPVHLERQLAPPEREGLQHPGQAEVVVRVVVRQEDLVELDEPDGRAKELPLGPFTAVEEDAVAPAPEQRPSQAAARRRHGA